jgi:transposase InsO family protein
VLVGDSLWETRALWPRPIRPLTAWTLDRLMAEDPVPGAVLELPFGPWDVDVPEAVMASAVIHKRRTTGLPRSTMGLQAEERLLSWLNLAAQAASPCAARAALAARGVRYMVWRDPKPDAPPRLTWLEEAFGPGAVIDGERYWTLEAPGEGCRD